MKKKQWGFTLIELLVVLTVLGLGIVLVFPSFGRMAKSVELKAAAKKATSILRYCRSEAVQKGLVLQVIFDGEAREIRIRPTGAEENQMSPAKGEEKEKNRREKDRYLLPEGVQVKELNFPPSQYPSDFPVIEFYPNGGSSGGSFIIERENIKAYRIQVNFLTGVVEIKEG